MRSVGKIAVQIVAAFFALVCSRALLAVAHSFGWFPEQQLAKLVLNSPTIIQTEWLAWTMLTALALIIWLVLDYLVYKREFRHFIEALWSRFQGAPSVDDAPGLRWTKLKRHWKAEWRATPEAIRGGYEPEKIMIWRGPLAETQSADVRGYILHRCKAFQADMLAKHPEPTIQDILAAIRRIIANDEPVK